MDLQATAQLLGNFGEFIAAMGVVGSMIFVGYQVRQFTRATRAQTHQAVTQNILSVGSLVSMRPEVFGKAAGIRTACRVWRREMPRSFSAPCSVCSSTSSRWALRRGAFTESFQRYLEASDPPDMTSVADLLQATSAHVTG